MPVPPVEGRLVSAGSAAMTRLGRPSSLTIRYSSFWTVKVSVAPLTVPVMPSFCGLMLYAPMAVLLSFVTETVAVPVPRASCAMSYPVYLVTGTDVPLTVNL